MDEVLLEGRLLKWGNSYGIRISKMDVERLGLDAGTDVVVRLDRPVGKVDLSHIRFIDDPDAEGKPFQEIRREYYLEKARRLEETHHQEVEGSDADR